MASKLWRKKKVVAEGTLAGPARVDARTKNLTRRLQVGDVAIINHTDLDRVAAENLVAAQPVAVLNAAKSISGRYPNLGPAILEEAGIPLIDDLGPEIMDISEGQWVDIDGARVVAGGRVIAEGTLQTAQSIARDSEAARAGMTVQLRAFAANTLEYLNEEQGLILDGVGIPDIRTSMEHRHVLVVVRGYDYREDLRALRPYIRENRPLMIGVDGGADALLELGYTPDIIVGDMDSVSDKALRCGAEVVVHAYRDGRAPGKKRVEDLGVDHVVFPATGTSEDVAMLLADSKGAKLIVAVGTHNTILEFLDKGRAGMASTFLTRLVVGGKLIDAKGVSRLYRSSISNWMLVALILAGVFALFAALAVTGAGQTFLSVLTTRLGDLAEWFRNLF
ncbi:putative cytokinetic ring protein SteA [Actinotignum sanguinis]|uniref:Cytokinetic ring protein SteA n=3 Tax=Actinomycetaceae TaxID=2049 RepID=A0ABZ0RKX9_9ACTO|nr:putative cytokinetic ring protein SteA [Actinotignum sanguinis]WPJ89576.1 putative cytokinetic ring protein SteA [Schaalia turicensis]MDE1553311.1 putative cytokinetic ring protein SteA [Actinotignum sanguinis]MDE1566054.1 putative cytokinetic ring protein SteA [Actinotignum sanguinis]MDE1577033.1 putative cytokinetic ring protein SteA [Actinotignum sanguinis]MDE1642468.1 putative cytokinetic ring protein SteA [Actinotignum sanguinis]